MGLSNSRIGVAAAVTLVAAVAAVVAGCAPKRPPTNSVKAGGRIVTADGIGDLTVLFTPPDKFRIVGSHPFAGRLVDIGGDGNVIWVVTDQQTTVMKGRVIVDDHEAWEPHGRTYVPPRAVRQE